MVNTMWFKAGVFRNETQLLEASKELDALEKEYAHCYVGDASHVYNTAFSQYIELGNLLQIAHAIVQGALARKECRGGHSRRDYPKRDDKNFLKHTLIFKDKRRENTVRNTRMSSLRNISRRKGSTDYGC